MVSTLLTPLPVSCPLTTPHHYIDKTKVKIFRKGGHIAAGEKWFYDGKEMEIVNSYKYLGFTLTTKLSNNSACEEYSAFKAKGKILDLMKTMWSLGSLDTSLFFKLFDAQIKPNVVVCIRNMGNDEVDGHRDSSSFCL